ncbi:MAG: glycosyltransferase family 2 protein [Candidatus Omnitrophota bacterium]
MDHVSISVILITKNEEKKIRRCLDSVRGLADEIIIVDDGSTDNTVRISSEEYNAKIIVHPSGGNFDRQRNLGIEKARGEWILQMDADEVIPENAREAVRRALISRKDCDAFYIFRRDCVFGVPLRHSGREKALKLFRKNKGRYTGGKIHETLKIDGKASDINTDILHYNFDSISEVIARWNFYTDVESASYMKNGGEHSEKFLKKRLLYKSLKLFYKHYVRNRAYKDGVYGLIWSILHVISPLLFWLKVLEKTVKEKA